MINFFSKTTPTKRDSNKDYDRTDFSDFFIHASAGEQKKVIKQSVHAANVAQQETTARAAESRQTR